jgi:tetratricopeptide (TPR) repeat protein
MKCFFCLVLPLLLAAPQNTLASESGNSEEDEDQGAPDEASPAPKLTPVAFDKRWLEPFFSTGPESKAAARFRAGDFAGSSKEFGRILAGVGEKSPERNPLRFLYALALMNQSSWQAAGDIFEDLWSTYPLLAPYHAYQAARCRLRRGDNEGAFTWLARIPSGSVPEAEAVMIKVDAFVAAKRWAEVETETSTFLDRFPKGPRRAEAMFQRAEALRELGRPLQEIAAAYRKVWAEAPTETWATRASERLDDLAKSTPAQDAQTITTHSLDELVSRGMLLFRRQPEYAGRSDLQHSPRHARHRQGHAVQAALSHRAVGVEATAAPARGPHVRSGHR